MAKKTVIKRALKVQSIGDRAARAIEHDNRAEGGEPPDYSDVIDVSGEVLEKAPEQITEAAPVKTAAERAKETMQEGAK